MIVRMYLIHCVSSPLHFVTTVMCVCWKVRYVLSKRDSDMLLSPVNNSFSWQVYCVCLSPLTAKWKKHKSLSTIFSSFSEQTFLSIAYSTSQKNPCLQSEGALLWPQDVTSNALPINTVPHCCIGFQQNCSHPFPAMFWSVANESAHISTVCMGKTVPKDWHDFLKRRKVSRVNENAVNIFGQKWETCRMYFMDSPCQSLPLLKVRKMAVPSFRFSLVRIATLVGTSAVLISGKGCPKSTFCMFPITPKAFIDIDPV